MSRPQIVLTNIRESRSFVRNTKVEDALDGKGNSNFTPIGPVERWLVFNDGAFEIPCGDALFESITRYLERAPQPIRKAVLPSTPPDVPEGASTFSAEDEIPPPPDEEPEEEVSDDDWSGELDEAEDGVEQL